MQDLTQSVFRVNSFEHIHVWHISVEWMHHFCPLRREKAGQAVRMLTNHTDLDAQAQCLTRSFFWYHGRIENLERLFTHWHVVVPLYHWALEIFPYLDLYNPFWNKTRRGKLEICDAWRRPKRIERTACRCHFREIRDFAAGCSILPLASSEIFAIVRTWDSFSHKRSMVILPSYKRGFERIYPWYGIPNKVRTTISHVITVLCLAQKHWQTNSRVSETDGTTPGGK